MGTRGYIYSDYSTRTYVDMFATPINYSFVQTFASHTYLQLIRLMDVSIVSMRQKNSKNDKCV